MSHRPAWVLSLFGFCLGLAAILSTGMPTATGQPKPGAPVPPSPQAPTLTSPANLGAKRGTTVELTLPGTNLADAVAVLLSCPGTVTIPTDNKNGTEPTKLRVKVEIPPAVPTGLHTIRVATKHGVSNLRPFVVDELPEVAEVEANRTKDAAQPVETPCVVAGRTDAEASDFFRVKVAAGQRLTFEVLARRIGSPLDPIVVLHDAKSKRELVDLYADDTPGLQSDCRLTHTFKEAGEVLVEVRDSTYRGGNDYFYRLRVGEFPGATTAFPLAVQRGKPAKVGFAGPDAADVPPVSVTVPTDPAVAAVYATPARSGGGGGWPVPVLVHDHPESVEQEPNNDIAKANKLPVPCGVSAKFAGKADLDHFAIPGKKGQKLVISALTYEVNAPTEVLIRVLDPKGKELAQSNLKQIPARLEYTPPADGELVIACEHANYLHGPHEVYHLSVVPSAPDFTVTLSLDRYEAPAGGGTAVAVANVTRLNGYAGPVELTIAGDKPLSGSVTVPAGQTQAFVPLMVKDGTKPGAYSFRVLAKATVDGKAIERYAVLTDLVKTTLGGMPNPPPDILSGCAVAVVEKRPFELTITADPKSIEKGKAGKLLFEAERGKGADGDIKAAVLFPLPAQKGAVASTDATIAKGKTQADQKVTVAPNAPPGKTPIVYRATTKVGGKDYAITPPPVLIDVTEPKKEEPKKDDTKKKEEPKKKGKDKDKK